MGRLVRRYIRAYRMTVVNRISALLVQLINTSEDIYPLHNRVEVADGVTVDGDVRSGYIQGYVGDVGTITGVWDGLRINLASHVNAVANNIYGIFMTNFMLHAPTNYVFIRCSENGGNVVRAGFYFSVGGGSDMTNLFRLASNCTAWHVTTNPSANKSGRIAVEVAGAQRYLQLWEP